jgi:hypothetical protein
MQQRRDGRCVGRCNNGTDQKPADPRSGEKQHHRCSNDRCRGNYPNSGQGDRGPQRTSDSTGIGAQPAEQNTRQTNAADQIGGGKLPKENAARSLSSGEHAQSEETRAAGEPRASLRTIRRKCSAAPICCRAKSADGWLPRLDRRADLPAATGSLTGLVAEGHEVLLTILSGGSLSIYVAWRPTTEIKPANRSACTNPAWDRESEYLPAETNARSRTGPRS